jgi:hypothetical protein
MWTRIAIAVTAAALASAPPRLQAQTPDPSGHWKGSVSSPQGELRFELDLEKTPAGLFGGSLDLPAERIAGLPLREVIVQGAALEFNARTDQGFRGEIAADGRTIAGTFTIEGYALPFTLTRAGAARVQPPLTGGRIASGFEGTWTTTMPSSGMRVTLQLANGAAGSTARLTNLDQGGLQIPGVAAVDAGEITVRFPAVAGSFAARLSADATELSGTYTQGDRSAPLSFRRQ